MTQDELETSPYFHDEAKGCLLTSKVIRIETRSNPVALLRKLYCETHDVMCWDCGHTPHKLVNGVWTRSPGNKGWAIGHHGATDSKALNPPKGMRIPQSEE